MRWEEREASSLYRANLGHYSCGGFLELITHEVEGRSMGEWKAREMEVKEDGCVRMT